MREDPIVLEDWKIGFKGTRTYKQLNYSDFSLSVLLTLSFFYLGYTFKNSFIVMIWGFYALYVFIMEGILRSNYYFNVLERYVAYSTTFILVMITIPFAWETFTRYSIIYLMILLFSGFILILKALILLFYKVLEKMNGNVLQPRSEFMKAKLKEQLLLLQGTSFDIRSDKEQEKLTLKTFQEQGITISFAFLLTIPGVVIYLLKWIANITIFPAKLVYVIYTTYIIIFLLYALLPVLLSTITIIKILEDRKANSTAEPKPYPTFFSYPPQQNTQIQQARAPVKQAREQEKEGIKHE